MAHRHVWIAMLILIVLLCFMVDILTAQNNDPRYIGCYNSPSIRDSGRMASRSSSMTVDVCAAECARQGSVLSGLFNGNSCWCSNNTVFNRTKCSGSDCCDVLCEGNANQTCGGTHSFNVYEAVVDSRYLGCYSDPISDRIFKRQYVSASNCIQYCGQQNYLFAGTQFRTECWCGSGNYSRHGRCISESKCICNMPCFHNSSEKCGAGNTMSVYKAECREPGKWDTNCQQTCNCYNAAGCHIKTGQCPNDECAPGWKGPTCFEKCPAGSYGKNCLRKCDKCSQSKCKRFNGQCENGCIAGWRYSPFCNEQCADGTFGINCTKTCLCQNGEICNKTDGKCPSGICSPGYDGEADPSCQKECESRTFGLRCAFECRCNKGKDCDKITGACVDNECSPGYTGPQDVPACQRECENGDFGVNCAQQCNCLNSVGCDRRTGHCTDGICTAGYNSTDKSCQTECQAGTFGVDCKQECMCSNIEDCDKVTGVCKEDRKSNALVPTVSSLVAVALLVIIILVAFILCRRRNHEVKQRQTEIPDVTQHCEEEPYHFYHDITDTPADQAVVNLNTPLPETRMEKNQVQGQCKYVNIGGDALYENTNQINDNEPRNIYEGVETTKQDEHNYLRIIK